MSEIDLVLSHSAAPAGDATGAGGGAADASSSSSAMLTENNVNDAAKDAKEKTPIPLVEYVINVVSIYRVFLPCQG